MFLRTAGFNDCELSNPKSHDLVFLVVIAVIAVVSGVIVVITVSVSIVIAIGGF